VLFIAVTMVSYIIFFLVPAEPARLVAGPQAPPDAVERARKFLHLDEPIWQQYLRFLHQLSPVTFDGAKPELKTPSLGRSFATRQEVNKIVKAAAPVTISLVIGGAILWMLIALPIGILSALRPRSLLDRGAMVFVLIGISAHPVWLGLLLSYFIGFKLGLTPLGGYCDLVNPSTACGGPVQWAHAMILPWITFAILFAALYVRMIRANVLEAMNEDYVRTARAKGSVRDDRDALARAPERDAARGDDARDGHRPRDGRRDLHRDGFRVTRNREDGRDRLGGLRSADRAGHSRVRDDRHHRLQPRGRPALRGHRPPNPTLLGAHGSPRSS
jgi:ABC-type dipeptide/oligopeptide/nickel transport system permease component